MNKLEDSGDVAVRATEINARGEVKDGVTPVPISRFTDVHHGGEGGKGTGADLV